MNNLKLFIKTMIIFFSICILIGLSFGLVKLIKRYMIVTQIANNSVCKYLENSHTYNYSKDVFYYKYLEEELYSERIYCKDDVLKKEYYNADLDVKVTSDEHNILKRRAYQTPLEVLYYNVNLTGIKYKTSNSYYEINPIEKQYKQMSNLENIELLYDSDVLIIDSIINTEFNSISNFWKRLSIVLNYNYEVYQTSSYGHIRKKDKNKEVYVTCLMNNDEFVLAVETIVKDIQKQTYTKTYYNFDNRTDITDNNIELNDLSGYKRVYNHNIF